MSVQPLLANAQSLDTPRLPPVTIHGDLTPEKQAAQAVDAARIQLDQRAGATAVIAADDFREGRAASLSDVMQFAPGVLARTRHGDETRFAIRGSGIQRGFLMRGIALYQDGIPLNHADGSGDFQSIDPLAAQHVEVWRGGNALEYGATQLGGAVNFVSPTGHSAAPASARLQAGSFGHRLAHASVAGNHGDKDGFLSLTRSHEDGYRRNTETDALRLSGNAGLRLTSALEARIFLTHIDTDMEMPGSLTRSAMAEDPRQAAPNYERLRADNNYRSNRLAARLAWSPSEQSSWITSVHVADKDRRHRMTMAALDQDLRDSGIDTRARFDFGESGLTRRVVLGASFARQHGDERRFMNVEGRRGMSTGHTTLTAEQTTLYGEYTHGLTRNLSLQAGVQAVRASRKLANHRAPLSGYDTDFGGINPKFGALYTLTADSQLYANVSRSFEPPPFGELVVRPTFPLASAQRATTIEAGYRKRVDDTWIDAVVYHSRIDGELLSLNDASGLALGTVNADRTIHQGIELGAQLPLSSTLRLRVNYLFNDFQFDGDRVYRDNRIAGLAPHVLHTEVKWQALPGLYVAPSLELQGGKTYIDHANTVSQGSHVLLNLRIGGDLSHGLSWFVEGRNLTDRHYVATTAVQADVGGRDGAYYFPGNGRALYAGLAWTL